MDIKRLEKKIRNGKGTFKDVNDIAGLSGRRAGERIWKQLNEAFPGGDIPQEEVRKIVSPILRENHKYVCELTSIVINSMYEKSKIGLKAVVPEYSIFRENDFVKEISDRSFEHEPE